jgi:glutathione S-transferase
MNTSKTDPLIRIHSVVPHDRGAKARWLLTELGIPFESRWLDREKNEFESPGFLRLNPMGRVPVLEYGDRVMHESGAICAFLADTYLDEGLAPPLSSPERAEYQQWMYFAASTVDPIVTRIMIIEDIPAGEVRQTKEAALLDDLRHVLRALDLRLSKSPYLVAERFSAADICVGYHLYWCKLWPELAAPMKDFPSVTSYLDRLEKMPSAVQAKVFSYQP